jgi:hypothetical protein
MDASLVDRVRPAQAGSGATDTLGKRKWSAAEPRPVKI